MTKYVGTATVVDIPSTITDGETTYEVVKLGNSLFAGTAEGTGSTVTSVTIPSNVLYTGTNIFLDNTNLTTLVINSNGIELSNQFARGTTNLTTVTINGYVKSLGTAAFFNTKVSTLVFPEGLISVADYALKSYYITDITIPSTIATATGDNILYGEKPLISDVLPSVFRIRKQKRLYVPISSGIWAVQLRLFSTDRWLSVTALSQIPRFGKAVT